VLSDASAIKMNVKMIQIIKFGPLYKMITRKNKTTLSFYLVTYRLFLVSVAAVESHMQFSKNPILKNFGDLPSGEIPEPLKYNRPFQSTTLSNGIRVCTERAAKSGSAT